MLGHTSDTGSFASHSSHRLPIGKICIAVISQKVESDSRRRHALWNVSLGVLGLSGFGISYRLYGPPMDATWPACIRAYEGLVPGTLVMS